MTNQEFRAIWKRTGLTLSQLASRLGITSADTVRNWASGKRPVSGPVAILMRMIDNDDQAARDKLVADLRRVWSDADYDSKIAQEYIGDRVDWIAERAMLDRTMTAAIAMIEKGSRWW